MGFMIIGLLQIQMSQIKQFKEFSTGNKLRDLISGEINPIIQRLQSQWKKIRGQMDEYKDTYQIMMKFDNQKGVLQKNFKEIRKELTDARSSLTVLKSDFEINHTKNNANYVTLKEELMSFQRTLVRRDQILTNYDRKINTLAQGFAKNQSYVSERLGIFEQKYKKLAKQTLQMTKDVKKEFQNSITSNQILKSELLHKIKAVQEKQHIMDLYLTQRQQTASKFAHLFQKTNNFVTNHEFQEYKKVHHGFLIDYQRKIEAQLQDLLPHDTKLQLTQLNLKYAQIEKLKQQNNQLEEIKRQIGAISKQIKGLQLIGDERIQKMRVETEQMQEKIIEVIDKKIETLQQNLEQQINTQTTETLEDKFKNFRQNFESEIYKKLQDEIKKIQSKEVKIIHPNPDQFNLISKQLSAAQQQRKKMQNYCSEIKAINDSIQDKLNLFAHRITVCRSNIELYTQNTNKELKKINALKEQQQNQLQQVGKIFSSFLQTLMIMASLQLKQEQGESKNTFVTFKDGIIYDNNNQQNTHSTINYRRNVFKVKQLKQSLLYELANLTDDLILNQPFLKIDVNKPSNFFQSLKSNFQLREKAVNRSTSLLIHTSRKINQNCLQQQENLLDYRRQSEQLFNRCEANSKTNITITNGNIPWPIEKNNSVIQRRYKGRRNQDKNKKQIEERNCITASRSHRKTKICFN